VALWLLASLAMLRKIEKKIRRRDTNGVALFHMVVTILKGWRGTPLHSGRRRN
jgi:hypothetical protein